MINSEKWGTKYAKSGHNVRNQGKVWEIRTNFEKSKQILRSGQISRNDETFEKSGQILRNQDNFFGKSGQIMRNQDKFW